MHTLVVYESMYGNTHAVAEGIAGGLQARSDVRVVPVRDASEELIAWADLVIVGGPTHAHGMTRSSTRTSALDAAVKPGSGLTIDPGADGRGIRDWFGLLGDHRGKRAAAFDTRVDAPALLTGRASGGIASELRHHGFTMVAKPESFLVDRSNRLVTGEVDRAARWGEALAGPDDAS
jgi:hypothetical protein